MHAMAARAYPRFGFTSRQRIVEQSAIREAFCRDLHCHARVKVKVGSGRIKGIFKSPYGTRFAEKNPEPQAFTAITSRYSDETTVSSFPPRLCADHNASS